MKKVLVLTLALVLAVTTVSASVIQIGPAATYKNDISNIGESHSYNDFGIGADLRINIPYFQVKALGSIGTDFQESFSAATLIGANIRLAQGPIEFAIGPAIGVDFRHTKEEGWTFNGYSSSEFENLLKASGIQWHASFGVNFGGIGVGLSAYVPTSGTIQKNLNLAPVWDKTKVSLSVLFNLL